MTMSQGFLSRFEFGPKGMRRLFNWWPPFHAAGNRVREIAPDFRNYVGMHFGGSLFAMTDPFFMIMMMKNLGPEYLVWDKAGTGALPEAGAGHGGRAVRAAGGTRRRSAGGDAVGGKVRAEVPRRDRRR
jgi:hypothetical protein